jgi:nitroimidazol reductase NimA-like FMN-containing flavoprotein (pyridoxamine 5'-phosphate oxidase superfamily)
VVSQSAQEREELRDTIRRVLERNRFAVLATQRGGQPHASLMAFTPLDDLRRLVFATYRGTLKHRNLMESNRVAVLIDDRGGDRNGSGRRIVLTALGRAAEVPEEDRPSHAATHLARHPDLDDFVHSPDCAVVRVAVGAYQVVAGIDDVRWYTIDDSDGA